MMLKLTATCDVCKAERKQTNHWWLVHIDDGGFHIAPWDDKKAKRKGMKHVCGQGCLQGMQDKWSSGIVVSGKSVDESLANIEKLTYPEEVPS
jgi:hypothetical protein